ncbi:MAG: B12-binding domain-containing radical SAM protein [Lachnospiraceae bacterium]|nr:B12-binding domain-containing radical SAM protein [Lachnospiraceae bacterium]
MKVLLTAVNAKYIHSNLAVYSLKACAAKYAGQVEIAEFTINQQRDYILQEIYRKKPDILAFSCYIWNISCVLETAENLSRILPETKIWLGGPEVSYGGEELLSRHPELTGIMVGEGERTFPELLEHYLDKSRTLEQIPGILYRNREGRLFCNPVSREYLSMDELPFIYSDMEPFANKIIYYESSRGCPFSCSYCLSSIDKRVRLRRPELVKGELQFFLEHQVPQVKFLDRTFNCNHRHAMEIWQYLLEHDNGITNFHFEIEADILTEEELELLGRMRPGLVQLEIGVQSVNPRTLEAVNRRTDFGRIARAVEKIASHHNIHQHLDLIAGLPFENLDSFRCSFDAVYRLHPQELQLGFLKVLKGSAMYEDAKRYGIVSRREPPYEVLFTPWLSYDDILKLKAVEEMLEIYYNSRQFACTIQALEGIFASPFELYEALAAFYAGKGLSGYSFSRLQRLELLREFAHGAAPGKERRMDEQLLKDLYLRENAKTRPEWAENQAGWKQEIASFYQKEEQQHRYLPEYEGYTWKQMMKMTHLERFTLRQEGPEEYWLLFDYGQRDPLSRDARTVEVPVR